MQSSKYEARDFNFGHWDLFRISNFKLWISRQKGFTLHEVLVYLALFLLLSVLVVALVIQMVTAGLKAARAREVVAAVSSVYDALFYEARFAQGVYTPTSLLSNDASQVSLRTLLNEPAGEPFTFVDFYLDNGRVFEKRESASPRALTSERVTIDRFRVTRRNPTSTSESLQVAIAAHHRFSRASEADLFAATSSITLRRY